MRGGGVPRAAFGLDPAFHAAIGVVLADEHAGEQVLGGLELLRVPLAVHRVGRGEDGEGVPLAGLAGVAGVADQKRGQPRQDELLVQRPHAQQQGGDHEHGAGDAAEADPAGEHRDDLAVADHLREREAHRRDEHHADEEREELEQPRPPQVADDQDRDDEAAQARRLGLAGADEDPLGRLEETVDVEHHVDGDDEREEQHQERPDVEQIELGDVAVEGAQHLEGNGREDRVPGSGFRVPGSGAWGLGPGAWGLGPGRPMLTPADQTRPSGPGTARGSPCTNGGAEPRRDAARRVQTY